MVLALKAQIVQAQAAPQFMQVHLLPKALVGDDGFPRKGQRSTSRNILCSRYSGVLSTDLPPSVMGDKPNTVVAIDGNVHHPNAALGSPQVHARLCPFLHFQMGEALVCICKQRSPGLGPSCTVRAQRMWSVHDAVSIPLTAHMHFVHLSTP